MKLTMGDEYEMDDPPEQLEGTVNGELKFMASTVDWLVTEMREIRTEGRESRRFFFTAILTITGLMVTMLLGVAAVLVAVLT